MTFQFAWVEPAETTFGPEHEREDEQVFGFSLEHTEGDFATLAIDVRNPRRRLLDGTDVWMWLAEDGVPLFFGRLVAVPEDLHAEIVQFSFVARPQGFVDTKRALADTMRVAPYWDPVWIREERLDDPDAVLEARTQLWHIDRVTHALTASDILTGEDGTLALGPGDIDYESLQVSYGAPPVRRVKVDAEVSWDQAATGTLDITAELVAAFPAAGSSHTGLISSFTGQGLQADWPEPQQSLGAGWSVDASATLQRADGVWIDPDHEDVLVGWTGVIETGAGSDADAVTSTPVTARFYLWEFKPTFVLAYDVSRQRIERVRFTLVGDVQRVYTEPGDEETLVLSLASRKVSEAIDADGALPIGDVRRRAYLKTDRGRQSLEYLITLARAKLLARARAAEVKVGVAFAAAAGLSCRMNAAITDDRLPDGGASGKVIGYRLTARGDGHRRAEVRIGCSIGTGETVAAADGTPDYVEDGYVEGWQVYEGSATEVVAGEVTYGDLSGVAVEDDGVDLLALAPADVITRLDVTNGEDAQRDVLDGGDFADIPEAVEALNAAHTEVCLELVPLTGGPFRTDYAPSLSALMVPRTITL